MMIPRYPWPEGRKHTAPWLVDRGGDGVRVVMLGPPGAGKGTQGVLLAAALGVPYISSSELLRQQLPRRSAKAYGARARMAAGDLVDDDVMVGLVLERLARPDARSGFVLDGFPRTLAQAAALDDWLAARGSRLDAVVLLEVPRQVLLERLAGRAVAEGRDDDEARTIAHRLRVYEAQTAPLVDYYARQGLLRRVDAGGDLAAAAARVLAALPGPPGRG
jgi:adenylate kinase